MCSTVVVFAMEAVPHLRIEPRLLVGGLARARAVHLCRPRGDGARKIELVGGSDLRGFSAPCGTHNPTDAAAIHRLSCTLDRSLSLSTPPPAHRILRSGLGRSLHRRGVSLAPLGAPRHRLPTDRRRLGRARGPSPRAPPSTWSASQRGQRLGTRAGSPASSAPTGSARTRVARGHSGSG